MLVDFISRENYNSYNVKLANILGLNNAIYLSTLIDIYYTYMAKNKVDESGFIKIKRDYVKSITTFTLEMQYELDRQLSYISLLTVKEKDLIKLDINKIISIFDEDNKFAVEEIKKLIPKKRSKQDVIKDELKREIKSTNGELRDAYSNWIDAVFSRQGWMTKASVVSGQQLIDKYSHRNLDIAIEILNIASINGYRDIQWAIDRYDSEKSKSTSIDLKNDFVQNRQVTLSQEVF